MFTYAIGLIYSDRTCDIYYGPKERVVNKLMVAEDRPYGKLYKTEGSMNRQLDYYKKEKPQARFYAL
ncbi:hypothetical protein [Paenibacillus chitinolyticus]|uniref:hypothetical protein n=1 Tax=Paenibacillus TaxID=44249 RepID=UPI001C450643|nr:hypothetical protein [Paenibacillus chitinolyticus]MBV6714844.1 hypothetical protein [Paenibacillus chitinolyticus]